MQSGSVNFTVSDLTGTALASLVFFPILFVPGYVLGWMANLMGFRQNPVPIRLLASVPFSIALTPILVYWFWRIGSSSGLWSLYSAFWLVMLMLLVGALGHEKPGEWITALRNIPPVALVIVFGWFLCSALLLADLQIGNRLYFSVITYDHSFRAAVTNSITLTGIPPQNPFYHISGTSPFRYHYFWFALCSVADQLGGKLVSPRNAVSASVVWAGFGLMSLIALLVRFFSDDCSNIGLSSRSDSRRTLIGIGLLGVTGLDLLGTLPLIFHNSTKPEMEWWNEQVAAWVDSMLWVPHNIGALVAGFVGFLLTWYASDRNTNTRSRVSCVCFAGLAFATSVGTSIYVALSFAASLAIWMLVTLVRRWFVCTGVLAATGIVSALLAVPYLKQLTIPGAGGTFLTFFVRDFYPLYRSPFSALTARFHSEAQLAWIRLLALPLNYFLELGFYFLVAVLQIGVYWRKKNLTRRDLASLCLSVVPLLLCSFLRSGVIRNNDFGYRGILLLQFILLLWGIDLIEGLWPRTQASRYAYLLRALTLCLLLIGVLSTLYGVGINRLYFPLADLGKVAPYYVSDRQIGKRTFAMRQLYAEMRQMTAPDAVVQANPVHDPGNLYFDDYAGRQTAASGLNCGTDFGGDVKACRAVIGGIVRIFNDPPRSDLTSVLQVCHQVGINALVIMDSDPVWKDPADWVWTTKPAAANDFGRVFLIPATATSQQ